MHGRLGRGEAKLLRCARESVLDVLIDIRPGSPSFAQQEAFELDDERRAHVPPGFLHGFQVTSDSADV
jgi:dTDP-4-dehydrorhamnose 3,5-epimerase